MLRRRKISKLSTTVACLGEILDKKTEMQKVITCHDVLITSWTVLPWDVAKWNLPQEAEVIFDMLTISEFILCMRPANERRRYNVTSSLIGWAHSQNGPCDSYQITTQYAYSDTGALFTKLAGGRLIARSRDVSKPRDSALNFFNRFELWQVPWQQYCRDACQI